MENKYTKTGCPTAPYLMNEIMLRLHTTEVTPLAKLADQIFAWFSVEKTDESVKELNTALRELHQYKYIQVSSSKGLVRLAPAGRKYVVEHLQAMLDLQAQMIEETAVIAAKKRNPAQKAPEIDADKIIDFIKAAKEIREKRVADEEKKKRALQAYQEFTALKADMIRACAHMQIILTDPTLGTNPDSDDAALEDMNEVIGALNAMNVAMNGIIGNP